MAKRGRVILSLVLLLAALKATTNFSVQRLPRPFEAEPVVRTDANSCAFSARQAPHEPFNEKPGEPFSFFEIELPDWLMPALGADAKTGQAPHCQTGSSGVQALGVFFLCIANS